MNRQDIVNELRDRGYVAEIKDVKKNGTVLKGIVILERLTQLQLFTQIKLLRMRIV